MSTLIGFVALCATHEEPKEGLGLIITFMDSPTPRLRLHAVGTVSEQPGMGEIKAGSKRTMCHKGCRKGVGSA